MMMDQFLNTEKSAVNTGIYNATIQQKADT